MKIRIRKTVCNFVYTKRLLSYVLLVVFLLSVIGVSPVYFASADPYLSQFNCDFESGKSSVNYSNKIDNTNISYIHTNSRLMMTQKEQSVEGNASLQINRCDIRWKDLHIEENSFRISFKVKLDESFDQTIKVKLLTQDPHTDMDENRGILLSIYKNAMNEIEVSGTDGIVLCKLQTGEIYTLGLSFERGSDLVRLMVNNKAVSHSFHFISNIFFVDGLGFESEGDDSTQSGYWILDSVDISVKMRTYQQLYSAQEKGTPVSLRIPDTDNINDLQVFVNATQILITDYYVSSQVIYIAAEQFLDSISIPYVYDTEENILSIETERVSVRCSIPGNQVTINGTDVVLRNPVRTIDGVLMISPNFINEVFNAKVWWDQDVNLLVITTGKYKTDGVLRKISSKLYMNGEPYYAMGYNALDLFQNVLSRYLDPKNTSVDSWIEEANVLLSDLSQYEIRTIRVLCRTDLLPDLTYNDVSVGKYLEAMDAFLDLCDRYNIQVVLSFDLLAPEFLAKDYFPGYGLITADESVLDLVSNSTSKSWDAMASFVEKFVSRYRNRNTILMYEIANQANLYADTGHYNNKATYSLTQLADYYQRCAKLIRSIDSDKLISSGDSAVLPYQWTLYVGTMMGNADRASTDHHFISLDQEAEVISALLLLNEAFDVISLKNPDESTFNMNTYYLGDAGVQSSYYSYSFYMKVASQLNKPVYNGAAQDNQLSGLSLQKAIGSGLQLSFWDTLSLEELLLNNQNLIAQNLVNSSVEENTNYVWGDSNVDVFDPAGIISIDDANNTTDDWRDVIYFVSMFLSMTLLVGVILFPLRKKKVV